jgi:hypothetical protein
LNVNGKRYLLLAGEVIFNFVMIYTLSLNTLQQQITLEGAWNECQIYNARLVSFEEEREYLDILQAIRNIGIAKISILTNDRLVY